MLTLLTKLTITTMLTIATNRLQLRCITKSGAKSPFSGIYNQLIIDFHSQMWCNLLRKEVQNHFFS